MGARDPAQAPERFDPMLETWEALCPKRVERLYHAIAALLPDGRVVVRRPRRLPQHAEGGLYVSSLPPRSRTTTSLRKRSGFYSFSCPLRIDARRVWRPPQRGLRRLARRERLRQREDAFEFVADVRGKLLAARCIDRDLAARFLDLVVG
jgi:hypothetical protein